MSAAQPLRCLHELAHAQGVGISSCLQHGLVLHGPHGLVERSGGAVCGAVGAVGGGGDFNAPAAVRGESYDCIAQAGWHDTYRLAQMRDDGITVCGAIDGWRGQTDGLRIDQIWCSETAAITASRVVLNGKQDPVVSDHYGVLIETANR